MLVSYKKQNKKKKINKKQTNKNCHSDMKNTPNGIGFAYDTLEESYL